MALPVRWALTSELTNNELSPSELAHAAAAVDVQLTRDLPQFWPVAATCQAFPDPTQIPPGYSPMTVMGFDQMPEGAAGFHYTAHREPAANIGYDPAEPLGFVTTASHEGVEGSVDPSGNRKVICTIRNPDTGERERVRVLVEPADPPEAYTYDIDQLPVSDFVDELFYGPHRWKHPAPAGAGSPGAAGQPITRAFSFCGYIDAPLVVAQGGYLSFVREDGTWAQITWFDGRTPTVRVLGRRDQSDAIPDRQWIDQKTAAAARPFAGSIGQ